MASARSAPPRHTRIGTVDGGWRRDGITVLRVNKGDLDGAKVVISGLLGVQGRTSPQPTWPAARAGTVGRHESTGATGGLRLPGVRAPIVAMKPGNAGGAKGC